MKLIKLCITCVFAAFLTAPAMGDPYPVPTNIVVERVSGGSYRFDVTWSLMDLPDAARISRVGATGSPFVFFYANDNQGTLRAYKIGGGVSLPGVSNASTMSHAGVTYYNKGITTSQWNGAGGSSGVIPIGACIGIGFTTITNGNAVSMSLLDRPEGACMSVPPVNETCDITTPSVTLDHGTLVQGYTTSTTKERLQINCTITTAARISFPALGRVIMSNGGVAQLTSNGNGVLAAGQNVVEIESTLSITPTTPVGPSYGSSVAYIEYL